MAEPMPVETSSGMESSSEGNGMPSSGGM
jgi:hypothetical protein